MLSSIVHPSNGLHLLRFVEKMVNFQWTMSQWHFKQNTTDNLCGKPRSSSFPPTCRQRPSPNENAGGSCGLCNRVKKARF